LDFDQVYERDAAGREVRGTEAELRRAGLLSAKPFRSKFSFRRRWAKKRKNISRNAVLRRGAGFGGNRQEEFYGLEASLVGSAMDVGGQRCAE
jgi:hypothetical protein